MLKNRPVQHLASLACVLNCSPLRVGYAWPWAMWLLKATWQASEWVTEQVQVTEQEEHKNRTRENSSSEDHNYELN